MADRFFCSERPVQGQIVLHDDEARHLSRVRRLTVGDQVEVFDGRGFATAAEVATILRDRVELRVLGDPLPDTRRHTCQLTLATAVPKGDRFDWLVEKATELGVSRLQPIVTERAVVDPRQTKLDRLRRAIIESSKQCGRNLLMELEPPIEWNRLVERCPDQVRLIAHPGGAASVSWPVATPGASITVAIGPEGGFTEAEVEAANARGWLPIHLGPTLLRIETAGIAAAAIALSRYG